MENSLLPKKLKSKDLTKQPYSLVSTTHLLADLAKLPHLSFPLIGLEVVPGLVSIHKNPDFISVSKPPIGVPQKEIPLETMFLWVPCQSEREKGLAEHPPSRPRRLLDKAAHPPDPAALATSPEPHGQTWDTENTNKWEAMRGFPAK